MCDELYEANINLRANSILLEDQNKILSNQLNELNEKIKALEDEKISLDKQK